MAVWINRETSWKKSETQEKSSFRTQELFGIIKDVYRKINRSKPAIVFPAHETIKALKDYQIEFEQKKSEAVAQWCHYKAFNR